MRFRRDGGGPVVPLAGVGAAFVPLVHLPGVSAMRAEQGRAMLSGGSSCCSRLFDRTKIQSLVPVEVFLPSQLNGKQEGRVDDANRNCAAPATVRRATFHSCGAVWVNTPLEGDFREGRTGARQPGYRPTSGDGSHRLHLAGAHGEAGRRQLVELPHAGFSVRRPTRAPGRPLHSRLVVARCGPGVVRHSRSLGCACESQWCGSSRRASRRP